jgi:hypothetical protein
MSNIQNTNKTKNKKPKYKIITKQRTNPSSLVHPLHAGRAAAEAPLQRIHGTSL